jgi:hypothetical protein
MSAYLSGKQMISFGKNEYPTGIVVGSYGLDGPSLFTS